MQEYTPSIEPIGFEKVWALIQETTMEFRAIAEQSKETDRKFQETDRKFQETDRKQQITNKQISELGKQIGGLNNKFGSYNEALFFPSLEKILEKDFGCKKVSQRYKFKDNGNSFEVDLFGYSDQACYLVEIKSLLKEEAITQLDKILEKFRNFDNFSDERKVFGLICATDFDNELMSKVIDHGFYFISAGEDMARLVNTREFIPKNF
ncbi:MAG: DUF3782 domain-containing protein [Candidatus Kapabacteria bacterium]|nr:DUF3782 domain-containing protein [Candidatus Kapabacteria bacterium]